MDTIFGISWVWWLLGTLGIGGTVALFFLAPVAFQVVLGVGGKVFRWLLSTRIGCALMAAVVAFVVADIHRSRLDAEDWKQRVAQFEAAQDARDKRIADDTRKLVKKELEDEAAAQRVSDGDLQIFKSGLPALPPDSVCRVGRDAERLRELGGGKARRKDLRRVWQARPLRGTSGRRRDH